MAHVETYLSIEDLAARYRACEDRVNRNRCPHARARARRAPIPASSDAERPARAAWAALRLLVDVAISF